MRHHRRHLAHGGHLFHVQHMLVRALQFVGLLLDPIFQRLRPLTISSFAARSCRLMLLNDSSQVS